MLAIISAIIGLLTSTIPSVIKYFEKRQEYLHEREILKLQVQLAAEGYHHSKIIEAAKAVVEEGQSLRHHDSIISTNQYINDFRAAVRPALTLFFFIAFITVKFIAVWIMVDKGYPPEQIVEVTWDEYTGSMFGGILGFWFGTRSILYISEGFKTKKEDNE
jgi:hypothetical protein